MAFVRRNRPWGCGTGEGGCESSDSTHSVHDRRALRQFTRGFTVSSDANLSPSFFPFSPLPFIRSPSSILLPLPSSFTPLYIQRCFNVGRFSRDLFFSPFSFFFFFFSPPPSFSNCIHESGLLEKLSNCLGNYFQKFPCEGRRRSLSLPPCLCLSVFTFEKSYLVEGMKRFVHAMRRHRYAHSRHPYFSRITTNRRRYLGYPRRCFDDDTKKFASG